MCRQRLESKAGVNYSVFANREVKQMMDIESKTIDFRVVDRRQDEKQFVEIHVVTHGDKRNKHDYATIELDVKDIRFLASAFVEMSNRLTP